MAKLTIFSKEEVERMYPKGTSQIAQLAQDSINQGCKIALVQNHAFNDDFSVAAELCSDVLKIENPYNEFVRFIDISRLENMEVIVAFKEN